MRHELRHVDQWFVLGPLFPVFYGLLLILFGYDRHSHEWGTPGRGLGTSEVGMRRRENVRYSFAGVWGARI